MSRRLAAALLLVVSCAVAAALVLARRAQPAYPVSDIALTEIYTRDAARGRLLVGPYSRFGWHHPGPLLFYLLAPSYAIGGANPASLHAGALALSLGAIAIAWAAAAANGSRSLATALILVAALTIVRLPALAASPWNPHAVVLPALALVALAAAAAAGDARVLPIVALVASFVAQSDVALAPFAATLTLFAIRRATRRALAWSAAVAVAVWTPAIVQELIHPPGNLTALWRFFTAAGRPHVTLPTALAAWSDAIAAPLLPGLSLAHGAIVEPSLVPAHVLIALGLVAAAVIAAVIATRRGDASLVGWFAALSAISSIVALWSVTRIEPPVSDHFTFWMAAIGMADLASAAALVRWTPVVETGAVAVASVAVAALGVREVGRAARGSFAITTDAPSAPNFAASIRRYLADGRVRRPLVRIDQDQWWLAAAILAELDREGVAYAVEDDWMPMFPDRFSADGSEDAELTLAAVGRRGELASRSGNVTVDESSFIHVEAIRRIPR